MTRFGSADLVDWNLAVATATRITRPGPEVTRDQARAVVAELRRHARDSEEHVRSYTGMDGGRVDTPVLVVDRPGWVRANAAGFEVLLRPLMTKVRERRANVPGAMMRRSRPWVVARRTETAFEPPHLELPRGRALNELLGPVPSGAIRPTSEHPSYRVSFPHRDRRGYRCNPFSG
jgi:hypothetical protein